MKSAAYAWCARSTLSPVRSVLFVPTQKQGMRFVPSSQFPLVYYVPVEKSHRKAIAAYVPSLRSVRVVLPPLTLQEQGMDFDFTSLQ